MKGITVALVAFIFALLSTGCGQSGPLYLPGNPSQIQNPPPAPADADDEKEQDSEENGDASTG